MATTDNAPTGGDWGAPAAPAKPASPLDLLASFGKGLSRGMQRETMRLATPVGNALGDVVHSTNEAANAALGTAGRMMQSQISHFPSNPRGVIENTGLLGPMAYADPAAKKQAGNLVYAATHPNDERIQGDAEHTLGVDRLTSAATHTGKLEATLKAAMPAVKKIQAKYHLDHVPGLDAVTNAVANLPLSKMQDFGVHTLFSIGTDPLTYAGAGGELAMERLGAGYDKFIFDALKPGAAGTGRAWVARNLATNPLERAEGKTTAQIAASNVIAARNSNDAARAQSFIDGYMSKVSNSDKRIMDSLNHIPADSPARQALLFEPWAFGTKKMRAQAEARGFQPTPELLKAYPKPSATLPVYDLRSSYNPQMHADPFGGMLMGQKRDYTPGFKFDKTQTGQWATMPLSQRITKRLNAGVQYTRTAQHTDDLVTHLGYTPEFAAKVAQQTAIGGIPALKGLSKLQTQAMILTGLPHIKNVGTAGYLAMGERGMARALQFQLAGIPENISKKLAAGGEAHFGMGMPSGLSGVAGVKQVGQATGKALQSWDRSVRAAYLEDLERRFPNKSTSELLNRVNQDIGEYTNAPNAVKLAKAFGANFPQWHGYNVPLMFGRAVVRSPGRVHRALTTEQNVNDYLIQDPQHEFTLGGVTDEGSKAFLNPLQYLWSPSTMGVIPTAAKLNEALSKLGSPGSGRKQAVKELGQTATEYGLGFLPFSSLAQDAVQKGVNPLAGLSAGAIASTVGKRDLTQKRRLAKIKLAQRDSQTAAAPSGDW